MEPTCCRSTGRRVAARRRLCGGARGPRGQARKSSPQGLAGLLPRGAAGAHQITTASCSSRPRRRRPPSSATIRTSVNITQPLFRAQNWIAYEQAKNQVAVAEAAVPAGDPGPDPARLAGLLRRAAGGEQRSLVAAQKPPSRNNSRRPSATSRSAPPPSPTPTTRRPATTSRSRRKSARRTTSKSKSRPRADHRPRTAGAVENRRQFQPPRRRPTRWRRGSRRADRRAPRADRAGHLRRRHARTSTRTAAATCRRWMRWRRTPTSPAGPASKAVLGSTPRPAYIGLQLPCRSTRAGWSTRRCARRSPTRKRRGRIWKTRGAPRPEHAPGFSRRDERRRADQGARSRGASQISLDSTKLAQEVGIRTQVDVLNARTRSRPRARFRAGHLQLRDQRAAEGRRRRAVRKRPRLRQPVAGQPSAK